MGEAPLWVGAAPVLVSLRMQTSWSKALGAPHQQRMKGLDRAHHSMHVQPLWCLMGASLVITGQLRMSWVRKCNYVTGYGWLRANYACNGSASAITRNWKIGVVITV